MKQLHFLQGTGSAWSGLFSHRPVYCSSTDSYSCRVLPHRHVPRLCACVCVCASVFCMCVCMCVLCVHARTHLPLHFKLSTPLVWCEQFPKSLHTKYSFSFFSVKACCVTQMFRTKWNSSVQRTSMWWALALTHQKDRTLSRNWAAAGLQSDLPSASVPAESAGPTLGFSGMLTNYSKR
jgi:hypothetical protein